MPLSHRASLSAVAAVCLMAAGLSGVRAAPAAQAPAAPASAPAEPAKREPYRSALTAELMFYVLGGEFNVVNGEPSAASEWLLEAAKRSKDERLFRRSMKLALDGADGIRALTTLRAWRTTLPQSREAAHYALLLQLRANRLDEAADSLRALVALTPAADRGKVLAIVPAALSQVPDKKAAAAQIDKLMQPFRGDPSTANAATLTSALGHKQAGDATRAIGLLQQVLAKEPQNETAALAAVELIGAHPAAEKLVKRHLASRKPSDLVRAEYARRLNQSSRAADAAVQIEAMTRSSPKNAGPWLYLGALRLDLRQYDAAEAALKRFLELHAKREAATPPAGDGPTLQAEPADGGDGALTVLNTAEGRDENQLIQAYLLLSQAAEKRNRMDEARTWLDKIPAAAAQSLPVVSRRAALLIRQNRIDEGRTVIQRIPASTDEQVRARYLAEAQVLYDTDRLPEAYAVFSEASKRFPDDTELLYQQSLIAEKLGHYDEMERSLRRIIELDKDHYNAHNALGFSLADRNQRLPEARQLIQRALELSPGDPYIIDSLAWVEFRQGNSAEALKLLRQAFQARQDPEIAAHLGEVLWSMGDRKEAKKVWRSAQDMTKDKANTTLQNTLKRLQVGL